MAKRSPKDPLRRILCFQGVDMTDIIVVGAGPAGLATALAAQKEGLTAVVVDQGSVVDALRRFPVQMSYFSTAGQLEIGGVPFIVRGDRPSRVDAVRYYSRVAIDAGLTIESGCRIKAIAGSNGQFKVRAVDGREFASRAVVVATGYFDTPRPFPVPGIDLPHVHRYYDEPFGYVGRKVALIGGKNSVVDAALELYRAGVQVTIVHRGKKLSEGVKYWLLPDIENRIAAGEITAHFESSVREIVPGAVRLNGPGPKEIAADVVFVMIGYDPDLSLLRSAGAKIDPATDGPVLDSESMQTSVPGLFVAGSLAAGRYNNKIFIENGRYHGERIVRSIIRTS